MLNVHSSSAGSANSPYRPAGTCSPSIVTSCSNWIVVALFAPKRHAPGTAYSIAASRPASAGRWYVIDTSVMPIVCVTTARGLSHGTSSSRACASTTANATTQGNQRSARIETSRAKPKPRAPPPRTKDHDEPRSLRERARARRCWIRRGLTGAATAITRVRRTVCTHHEAVNQSRAASERLRTTIASFDCLTDSFH
jgi:hypothetical protein